jgi:hypothetical protein
MQQPRAGNWNTFAIYAVKYLQIYCNVKLIENEFFMVTDVHFCQICPIMMAFGVAGGWTMN